MIEVDRLTFRYPQSLTDALTEIRMTIPDGSFVAIMGSNGSGKSTFARSLNGLLLPTSGEVRVDGVSTKDVTVRQKVGLVFQDPNLQMTSASIERELAFGLENGCVDREEMLVRVNESLCEFGFEERRNDPPSSLSAGERQRLAVASVLVLNPSYLVLDEATSLLSGRSRTALLEMVISSHHHRHAGLVLITQYPSEALMAQRLLILHEGALLFDDEPGKVFENAEELARIGVSIPVSERMKHAV